MTEPEIYYALAIHYAISFFVFGWLVRGWHDDDKSLERFWLIKYYWRKWIKK